MQRVLPVIGALVLSMLAAQPLWAADEDGFKPIFNGQSLEGWDGNPDLWSVRDGAITGQTTAEKPTKGNTFLIWRQGELDDFELKLEYKIVGGNSGIQYRSFEVPDQKWVIGGYQADFEAGNSYSGILYGEKDRGILAQRGQKTVIGDNHKPTVVGQVGNSAEIQAKIKKEDWNEYHIIAKGNQLTHKINGVTTVEVTDNDKTGRRMSGVLALQLHAGPPMLVQFRNIRLKRTPLENAKKVVFIAGNPSHGFGAHDHKAGCTLLANHLKKAYGEQLVTAVYAPGWPKDPTALDNANAMVIYADGGGNHPIVKHVDEIAPLAKKGMGTGFIHYGVEVEKGKVGDAFLDWTGGYFEAHWSVNPHWTIKNMALAKDHPVTRGVRAYEVNDEWYYHMRFRPNNEGVAMLVSALPPDETLSRPDGAHSGNPAVREAIKNKQSQAVMWGRERPDSGRGFGFTGGHVHWNWGHPDHRRVVLNAVAWIAGLEVSAGGVPTDAVTLDELLQNHDEAVPGKFNREPVQKMLDEWNKPAAP